MIASTDTRTCVCCGERIPTANHPAHLRACIRERHGERTVVLATGPCPNCGNTDAD